MWSDIGTSSIDCNFVHSGSWPTKVYIFGKNSSRSLQKYVLSLVFNLSMRSYNAKREGWLKVTRGLLIKKNCYITISFFGLLHCALIIFKITKSLTMWFASPSPDEFLFHQINIRNREISISTFQKYIVLQCFGNYEQGYNRSKIII